MSPRQPARPRSKADEIIGTEDASLLDVVDHALSKGVVLSGDLTLGLARVDLVYAQLSLLLAAADRVLPGESPDFIERRAARRRRGAAPSSTLRRPRRRV